MMDIWVCLAPRFFVEKIYDNWGRDKKRVPIDVQVVLE